MYNLPETADVIVSIMQLSSLNLKRIMLLSRS